MVPGYGTICKRKVKSNYSIKKIVDSILYIENKYNLLKWKIDGVLVWQSARTNIYTSILDLDISNNSLVKTISFSKKIKDGFHRFIVNSIFYNPFLDFSESEVLVFDSGRKYLLDKYYVDIYTHYLCEDLERNGVSVKTYNTNYQVDNLADRSLKVKHLDFIYITSKLLSKFINVTLNINEINQLRSIEDEINLELGVKLDLKTLFISEIVRFKTQYLLFKMLFQIKKANRIFIINSGSKAPLIKAAKDCKIVVNELQHGLVVKEGLVANFPNTLEDSLEYFPDKFYVWKDLDMCTGKLPLSNENIESYTNRHLQNMLIRNSNVKRNQNQILIVSQPYNSKEILNYIMNSIEDMKEWTFIYKIHPVENIDSFTDSSEYKFSKYENLNFVAEGKSIYQLFSESEYVIGIFSTALFEASYFGCKIILLDLPGVEMATSLVTNGKAILLSINKKLSTTI